MCKMCEYCEARCRLHRKNVHATNDIVSGIRYLHKNVCECNYLSADDEKPSNNWTQLNHQIDWPKSNGDEALIFEYFTSSWLFFFQLAYAQTLIIFIDKARKDCAADCLSDTTRSMCWLSDEIPFSLHLAWMIDIVVSLNVAFSSSFHPYCVNPKILF